MRLAALLLLTLFAGCAQFAGSVPSLQHCDKVSYVRDGNRVSITAQCSAPIGGGALTL
jgi:hypothetical protein